MIFLSLLLLCLIVSCAGYGVARLISIRTRSDIADHALFAFPLGTAVIGWIEFVCGEFIGIPVTAVLLYSISGPLAIIGVFMRLRILNRLSALNYIIGRRSSGLLSV
jgi:hypothetical protein